MERQFKLDIGFRIIDNKRDLTILDTIRQVCNDGVKRKFYKVRCNKCGYVYLIKESNLITHQQKCGACCQNPSRAVLGINTIWDRARWMCDLGISEEDAKKYTYGSKSKVLVKCKLCGREKHVSIASVYRCKTIGCICGDGYSYPEKFVFSILEQLSVDFQTQYSFNDSNKRYDFYFKYNNENYIIETHGEQHYIGNSKTSNRNNSLKEELENDKYKKTLALVNGIKEENYIVVDCRKSELEWIKNHIIECKLNELFDLNKVDWIKCEKFALSNITKMICEYWTDHDLKSARELELVFKRGRSCILKHLSKGSRIGWCDYNKKIESEYYKQEANCILSKQKIRLYVLKKIIIQSENTKAKNI